MMVGCSGDNGKFCKGQIAEVKPGKKYTLTKCSCPPYASGCLVIGKNLKLKNDGPQNRPRVRVIGNKVPNKCVLTHKNNVCGTNGHAINVDFKVTCKKEVCPVPNPVLNVKVTCPNCNQESGSVPTPTFCGGIAGVACPVGYSCQLESDNPDAGGTCVPAADRETGGLGQ
jgi:hypothetical protein